jgi:hypothetical protein
MQDILDYKAKDKMALGFSIFSSKKKHETRSSSQQAGGICRAFSDLHGVKIQQTIF